MVILVSVNRLECWYHSYVCIYTYVLPIIFYLLYFNFNFYVVDY